MRKIILSLVVAVLASTIAVTAEGASSAAPVADVGAAGITAEGEVYNLASPADLSGDYSAVTAGMTIVEGGSVAYLKNEKGVVISCIRRPVGCDSTWANGMHVTLQQS
jgi:hypothetical protein